MGEKTEMKNRKPTEYAPKYLNGVAQHYYRKIVAIFKDRNVYDPIDNASYEMLAWLYGEYRNEDASQKDRRESIKLFFLLCKDYGITLASRQKLLADLEAPEEDPEGDIKEDFFEDIKR